MRPARSHEDRGASEVPVLIVGALMIGSFAAGMWFANRGEEVTPDAAAPTTTIEQLDTETTVPPLTPEDIPPTTTYGSLTCTGAYVVISSVLDTDPRFDLANPADNVDPNITVNNPKGNSSLFLGMVVDSDIIPASGDKSVFVNLDRKVAVDIAQENVRRNTITAEQISNIQSPAFKNGDHLPGDYEVRTGCKDASGAAVF